MLQRGDLVPHFNVRSIDGRAMAYSSIWQRRNLVLISLASHACVTDGYAACIAAASQDDQETVWIVTEDAVDGVPHPGVVVSDRWGEIVHIASASQDGLPNVDELLEWVSFTRMRCPECEGETK
jgi:hypothetical protein